MSQVSLEPSLHASVSSSGFLLPSSRTAATIDGSTTLWKKLRRKSWHRPWTVDAGWRSAERDNMGPRAETTNRHRKEDIDERPRYSRGGDPILGDRLFLHGRSMMKLTTVSLCMLLSFLYGCKSTGVGGDPAKRKAELAKVIAREWSIGSTYGFEVDGPLSIVEVEEKLRTSFQEKLPRMEQKRLDFLKDNPYIDKNFGLVRTYEDTGEGTSWQELKAKRREGDELYFFTSEEMSWVSFHGVKGYALIRGQDILHMTCVRASEGVMQMPPEQWKQVQRERRLRQWVVEPGKYSGGMGGYGKSCWWDGAGGGGPASVKAPSNGAQSPDSTEE